MLSGENSILQKATDAKEQTGIGQEKEIVALAYNSALAKKVSNSNSDAVTDSELNDELDNSEATASGNPIIVTFTKSGNAYEIDSKGVIKPCVPKDPTQKTVNELEVGDYVKYGVKLTQKSYSTLTSETGYDSSQTFETDTSMLWRVISNSNGKVELVATQNVIANDSIKGLYLCGKTGFLNAEIVLKNLCETLYNSDYGTARSININDLNNLSGFAPETNLSNYNKSYTYTTGGPFWDKSTNTFKERNSTVTVYNDAINYTLNEDIPLADTLLKESKAALYPPGTKDFPKYYWISGRSAYAGETYAQFNLMYLFATNVTTRDMCYADTDGNSSEQTAINYISAGIRPIVTLNTGSQITLGDGTQETPYEL